MKKIFPFLIWFVSAGGIFFACKKEYSCENCLPASNNPLQPNHPPEARAGAARTIFTPQDTLFLDGGHSKDADGFIARFLWRQIDGAPATIDQQDSVKTLVHFPGAGIFQFELKVTDDDGAEDRDTVKITVTAPAQNNRPPNACAGGDQVITLPSNVTLDGTCSSDPDNNLTHYLWVKISGPSLLIVNPYEAEAQATNLVEGVYFFELTVSDAGGLSARDTVQVTVNAGQVSIPACDNSNRPVINANLVPVGMISQARTGMAVASVGNKILFAGGVDQLGIRSSTVDIYDRANNSWSVAELCTGRYLMAAVSAGDKIFFAGGEVGDGTWPVDSVDIYDASSNRWSVAHLSLAGNSIAAAAVGNKVLFAGGDGGYVAWGRDKRVDIFHLASGAWTTATLSEEKRGGHTAITAAGKIFVAGGETMITHGSNTWEKNWGASDKIDVYEDATSTWSTASLGEGKLSHAAIVSGDRIFWAGGYTGRYPDVYASCNVEIRNTSTGTSTVEALYSPATWSVNAGQNACSKDNKLLFCRTGERDRAGFDVYDLTSNRWFIGVLPKEIPEGASILSVNNTVYIAGGLINGVASNQVWKVDF